MTQINFPKIFKITYGDDYEAIPFLQKVFLEKNELIINAGDMREISEEAFLVLKAQLEKRYLERALVLKPVLINGYGSKTVFWFFKKNLNYRTQRPKSEFHVNIDINGGDELKETKVDTNIIDNAVKGLEDIRIDEYYEPLYDFLVELIGNAAEHGLKNSKINWWLKWYRVENSICFIFVDMGMGVAQSYKKSKLSLKYYFLSDKYIVRDALNGILGSSTKEDNRGRGMPLISKMVRKKLISDFLMVTNKVSVSFNEEKFVYSRNPDFMGTFFAWTINRENFEIWKTLR